MIVAMKRIFYNILIQPKILQTKRAAQPRLCPVKTASGWDESVGAHTGRHHHRGVAAGVGGDTRQMAHCSSTGDRKLVIIVYMVITWFKSDKYFFIPYLFTWLGHQ